MNGLQKLAWFYWAQITLWSNIIFAVLLKMVNVQKVSVLDCLLWAGIRLVNSAGFWIVLNICNAELPIYFDLTSGI